jgi:hypothetical protein
MLVVQHSASANPDPVQSEEMRMTPATGQCGGNYVSLASDNALRQSHTDNPAAMPSDKTPGTPTRPLRTRRRREESALPRAVRGKIKEMRQEKSLPQTEPLTGRKADARIRRPGTFAITRLSNQVKLLYCRTITETFLTKPVFVQDCRP